MQGTPLAHRIDDRLQGAAVLGHPIQHLGHLAREGFALDQQIALQLLELLGEHLRRQGAHQAQQLACALGAFHQVAQDGALPAPADGLDGSVDGKVEHAVDHVLLLTKGA